MPAAREAKAGEGGVRSCGLRRGPKRYGRMLDCGGAESGKRGTLREGRGGARGEATGRTGAYGADPSGASANVSVSVSAGRASGPADIIQEVTSRTCPVIPSPLPSPPRRRRARRRRRCFCRAVVATLSRPPTDTTPLTNVVARRRCFVEQPLGGFRVAPKWRLPLAASCPE